jgi:hypothetical protein
MPSAKYLFLTEADEKTLSTLLREKFPDIRFCARKSREQEFRYYPDIASCPDNTVDMFLAPATWEPEFKRNETAHDEAYKVVNYPDEWMFYYRHRMGDPDHVLDEGTFQVGVTPPPMSKRQLSLTGKIWRLLPRMGTYTLMVRVTRDRRHVWIKAQGKMFFAGDDAVRWALEDDGRYFQGTNLIYRPFKPDVSVPSS